MNCWSFVVCLCRAALKMLSFQQLWIMNGLCFFYLATQQKNQENKGREIPMEWDRTAALRFCRQHGRLVSLVLIKLFVLLSARSSVHGQQEQCSRTPQCPSSCCPPGAHRAQQLCCAPWRAVLQRIHREKGSVSCLPLKKESFMIGMKSVLAFCLCFKLHACCWMPPG